MAGGGSTRQLHTAAAQLVTMVGRLRRSGKGPCTSIKGKRAGATLPDKSGGEGFAPGSKLKQAFFQGERIGEESAGSPKPSLTSPHMNRMFN